MSGILDAKTRMLDTIITREGKRQLALGKLRVEFISFTDGETFYEKDILSGSADPTMRLFFEAADLPHDQITFEADDSGKLMPFRSANFDVIDGKVLSGSTDNFLTIVTGSAFASTSEQLLDSSINSFLKHYVIRTDEAFFDEEREFDASNNSLTFTISNYAPFRRQSLKEINVDKAESLINDKRLTQSRNFFYLPPVNKPQARGLQASSLGNFPPLGRTEKLTYDQLMKELREKELQVIEFSKTSLKSNVFTQMFELVQDKLSKLDVIDFGAFITNDEQNAEKHVFFVGKVYVDSFGSQTFMNIFTIIFE